MKNPLRSETLLVHGGLESGPSEATALPIVQSSAFAYDTAESLEDVFRGRRPGQVYTRIGNPTAEVLERRLSLLEGGGAAVVTASGMAAITEAVLTNVRAGDEILSSSSLFGGTGNSIGGAIVDRGTFDWGNGKYPHFDPYRKRYRPYAFAARLRKLVHKDAGGCVAPMNAFLFSEGVQTSGLRMARHCDNALAPARFLAGHPAVRWVNYPGLPVSPHHEVAGRRTAAASAGC